MTKEKFVPITERKTYTYIIDATDYMKLVDKLNKEHITITMITPTFVAGMLSNKLVIEAQEGMSLR